MRYVGGKTRIAKWIEDVLLSVRTTQTHYLEPFVGSGAVFCRMSRHFDKSIAADYHEDLILMWKAIASGWVPPDWVSKDEYYRLKVGNPSALRGLVGFGSSFGGKWFGGYTDTTWDSYHCRMTKPYLKAAVGSLLKMSESFSKAEIKHADYKNHEVDRRFLVYCDPPYRDTLGYGIPFNSNEFWATADGWVDSGALVIVSEQIAPSHWEQLNSRTRKALLKVVVGTENDTRQEILFTRKS